jgi:HAD superfamily hydrolase (TIGR01490 family)
MRASFFDIDGTLTKGFIIYEFPKYLVSQNLFEKKYFDEMTKVLHVYLKKEISYREAAFIAPRLYASGIKGKRKEIIEKEAMKFIELLKDRIFPYSIELVRLMKNHGMTIAISGSPIEPVKLLKRFFSFDLIFGSKMESKDGVYTGEIKQNLIITETKKILLKDLVKTYKIDLKESFGFGDTDQDLSILSKVGHPIALNPNSKLLKIVKQKGWPHFDSDEVLDHVKNILGG